MDKATTSTVAGPGSAFEKDKKVRRVCLTGNTAAARVGKALPIEGNVDHHGLVVAHLYSSTDMCCDDLSIGIVLAGEVFDGVHLTRQQWEELRGEVDQLFRSMDAIAKVEMP